MTTPAELLPPDPAVPGLWWVTDSAGQHDVWRWRPDERQWSDTMGEMFLPWGAWMWGWRCVGPAVPPKEPAA